MTNADGREAALTRAKVALDAYGVNDQGVEIETVMGDLIADLMHYADVNDIDLPEILEKAMNTFESDRAEWDR